MIFIENKYTKIYCSIIHNARSKKYLNCNTEKHHIIPKSLGGDNSKDNIVEVSCREHYILHKLLVRMVTGDAKKKMWWALHRMSTTYLKFNNSRMYNNFRKDWSKFMKENHHSKVIEGWSEKMSQQATESWKNSDERRRNCSVIMKQTIENIKSKDEQSFYIEQKRRAKIGGLKSKEKNATRIEYKGVVYLGWNELKDRTRITKDLYKKYYINGYDPELRMGKDGPLNVDDIIKYSLSRNVDVYQLLEDMSSKKIITVRKYKTLINEYERRIGR